MGTMQLVTMKRFKSLKGKRALLRVDFNVPLAKGGKIPPEAEQRIREGLPTIQKLVKSGAKTVIVSHLGRPEGPDKKLSLAPVVKHLAALLGKKVLFVADSLEDDEKVEKKLASMKNGDVAVLENIRFYKGEEKNSLFFARRLASLGDLFINDAFAVAHREAASNAGLANLLPSAAGLLMEKEVHGLSKLLSKPSRPFIVLMGGAKISTKLPTLEYLFKVADTVLIGGGMANSFFKAKGYKVGKSLVSNEDISLAKRLLKSKKLVLPSDVLVTTSLAGKADVRVAAPDDIRQNEYVVDIGTQTMRDYALTLKQAETIVWNGPVGLFEVKKFSYGSTILGRVIAARSSGKAYGVVGGGETVECLQLTGMAEYVDHVSTGGGAMLDFLAGKTLPGLKPLMTK